ncbi:helix-turn-helix transcriptional regulator [Endozoicomonas sp. G2_1]|uniref:helix-turn-helix transcriptional regulator n=1 Tax=Endozoicomonas sp. G2_1 TaxID=2821091 RepID=UPI001ADC61D6|nr:helix-turn-helix transcriptional regulator [Endozoicomonas sp. G2_1]MBO9490138.1 helix-turn-helix transcriptional regulator [Endozoicomonas sp. G2_1]
MSDSFAGRLQALLEQREVSIHALAKAIGVSRQSIYNWLASDHISTRSVNKIAHYFAVSPDWLKFGNSQGQERFSPWSGELSAVVDDNLAITKQHLTELGICLGRYYFDQIRLEWIIGEQAPLAKQIALPIDVIEIRRYLTNLQWLRLKKAYIKLCRSGKGQTMLLTLVQHNISVAVILLPLINQAGDLVGLTFNLSQTELASNTETSPHLFVDQQTTRNCELSY